MGRDARNGAGRLEYQHSFHAGNAADVFKHTLLSLMIRGMLKKDGPVTYVDTHSGAGMYDLQSFDGLQLREWECGIERIVAAEANRRGGEGGAGGHHEAIGDLATSVSFWNEAGVDLRYYPGSPLIAGGLLREVDTLIAIERNEAVFVQLEQALRRLPQGSPKVGGSHPPSSQTPCGQPSGLLAVG